MSSVECALPAGVIRAGYPYQQVILRVGISISIKAISAKDLGHLLCYSAQEIFETNLYSLDGICGSLQ